MDMRFAKLGFYPADILLPEKGADMTKWAVVACDQFTSQPEYWQEVEEAVQDAPSALRLILPEVWLEEADVDARIPKINAEMERYLHEGVFQMLENSMLYIRRVQSDGRVRQGLIGMVDLEQYDFTPGSGALIRATERTVLERIPPRVRVRENAVIELPHVMLLVDDPQKTMIEPMAGETVAMTQVYDFDLMCRGGHIAAWKLTDKQVDRVATALEALASPAAMAEKYGLRDAPPLLFAVGDGNHSLATAKACYEERKKTVPQEQWATLPERYALVEVVNNHDDALQFEPIHRVLFGVEPQQVLDALKAACPGAYEGVGDGHVLRYSWAEHSGAITVPNPKAQLEVGTLQPFLDAYLCESSARIDYIHGDDTAAALGAQEGNLAFLLPAMGKEQLFKTVMADGVLPRKTFSMGHAEDKRYYVEARKIR